MIPDYFVWIFWASAFLVAWMALYAAFPGHRRAMWWASLFTLPFGLTEPLFVPEYWDPPSLFDLAQKTGFDIESFIFCFAIGGVAAVLYDILTGRRVKPMLNRERHLSRHRYHSLALSVPFIVFAILVFLPWNPIYTGVLSMFAGALATILCRPDLKVKIWVGGVLFVALYTVFLQGLRLTAPGYIERVWNLKELLGVDVFGMPVEELLFASGFGTYWSGVYEHFTWRFSHPIRQGDSAAKGNGTATD